MNGLDARILVLGISLPGVRPLRRPPGRRSSGTTDLATAHTITVNGEQRGVADGDTVATLVAALGLTDKRIAVERNGEIVPRSQHGQAVLADGDRLEIVVAVGGG